MTAVASCGLGLLTCITVEDHTGIMLDSAASMPRIGDQDCFHSRKLEAHVNIGPTGGKRAALFDQPL